MSFYTRTRKLFQHLISAKATRHHEPSNRRRYFEFLEQRCLLSSTPQGQDFAQSQVVADNPPIISGIGLSIAHNATYTFSAAIFNSSFADVDAGDTLHAIKFSSLPTYGILNLSGAPIAANQVIAASAIPQLTFTAGSNFAGNEVFAWNGSDGTLFATSSANITFNVAGSAPTLSTITKATLQNAALTFDPTDFVYAFNEPNFGPNITSIKITALPSQGTLTLLGAPVTLNQVISADGSKSLTQKIQALVYTPTGGYVGVDTIGWNATDGLNYAATAGVINVNLVSSLVLTVSGNGNTIPTGNTITSRNDFTDFGDMTTSATTDGQTATRTYTITNHTASTVNLTGGANLVQFTGANAIDFTLTTPPAVSSLAAGASTTFTITFAPKAAGARSATVSIPNSAGAAFTYALAGTGVTTSTLNNGLQGTITLAGTGTAAPLGSVLTMEYTGFLLNGTRFDSSLNLDRTPFQFAIGLGQVISGWDSGLSGVMVGEKRFLVIPAALGYGNQTQSNIPPNSTLIFEVQCLAIGVAQLGVVAKGGSTFVTEGSTSGNAADLTNFGTLASNTASASQVFTITGTGYSSLDGSYKAVWYYPTTTEVTLSGPNASDFTLTHAAQNTYSVVDPDSFTVQFNRPTTSGTRTAIISIFTNDAYHPTYTFTVQGSAAVDLTDSIGTTSFPNSTIYSGSLTTLTLPVIVKNLGSQPTGTTATDIQVFAHDKNTGTNTLVTTFANQSMSGLGYNQTRQFNLTFTLPVSLVTDAYTFTAVVNASNAISETDSTNNSATSTQSANITQGTYDLTGTLGATNFPTPIAAGAPVSGRYLGVTVQNTGTILLPSVQSIQIQVNAHNTGDNSDTPLNTPTNLNVSSLAAGGSATFYITLATPGLPLGNYILTATITPVQPLTEVSLANNVITQDNQGQTKAVQVVPDKPDLTVAFGTAIPNYGSYVPGDTITLPVTVTNLGIHGAGGTALAPIIIDIRSSANNVYDVTDTAITQLSMPYTIAAFTSIQLYATFKLPATISPGSFYGVAMADSTNVLDEVNKSNNTAATAGPLNVVWQFGNVPGRPGYTPFTFNDTDGTQVTLNLYGPGVGTFTSGANGYDIAITGSTAASSFMVGTVKTATPGDDGRFTLHNLTIGNPSDASDHTGVGLIYATTTDLSGNITVTGPATNLYWGNVAGQHTISIGVPGGVPVSPPSINMIMGSIQNLTINSGIGISLLQATDWQDTDATPDTVTAPWLGTLYVVGDRAHALNGDFQAGLHLTSPNGMYAGYNTLTYAYVAGSTGATTWDIAGKIGTVLVSGSLGTVSNPWNVIDTTGISYLNLGDIVNGTLTTVGDVGTIIAKRWQAGALSAKTLSYVQTSGQYGTNAFAGDFNAGLTLSGPALYAGYPVLGTAYITGSVSGTTWDITGQVGTVIVSGTLGTVGTAWTLKDLIGATYLNLGDVVNGSLTTTGSLTTIIAKRWQAGSISARTLSYVQTSGQYGTNAFAGDFNAGLTLSGPALYAGYPVLGTAYITGSVSGTTWDITGQVGTVIVSGTLGTVGTAWTLKDLTGATYLNLGDVVNGSLTATGDLTTIIAKRWQAGSISAKTLSYVQTSGQYGTNAFAGDFNAGLTLSGPALYAGYPVLGTAYITGSISGTTWDITGQVGTVIVSGTLGTVGTAWTLKDLTGASYLNLGDVVNGSLTTAGNLTTILAKRWQAGSISARTLSYVQTSGQYGTNAFAGDFDANLTLNGPGLYAGGPVLGTAVISGQLASGTWNINGPVTYVAAKSVGGGWSGLVVGNVGTMVLNDAGAASDLELTANAVQTLLVYGGLAGSHVRLTQGVSATQSALGYLYVAGTISQSEIRSSGNIGTVIAGSLDRSILFAGVKDTVSVRPAAAGDFVDVAAKLPTIQYLSLTYQPTKVPALTNSYIAAGKIVYAVLPNLAGVVTDGDGVVQPFGFATVSGVTTYSGPVSVGDYISGKDSIVS